MQSQKARQQTNRRNFFRESLAIILGGLAALLPAVVGITVLTDPLRRKTASDPSTRITTLDALPDDGIPRKFPVMASRSDAWNKFENVPVGAVYLRRTGDGKVNALNVVCPHAGCFVDFSSDPGQFLCPCHKSSFKVTGEIADPGSPSPRAMDSLPVEIRRDGSIWVKFQNFEAGESAKIPVA